MCDQPGMYRRGSGMSQGTQMRVKRVGLCPKAVECAPCPSCLAGTPVLPLLSPCPIPHISLGLRLGLTSGTDCLHPGGSQYRLGTGWPMHPVPLTQKALGSSVFYARPPAALMKPRPTSSERGSVGRCWASMRKGHLQEVPCLARESPQRGSCLELLRPLPFSLRCHDSQGTYCIPIAQCLV